MDYAQSRLQARFGERPDESFWQKLEAAPEPAAALEIARSSGLSRYLGGIAPNADGHSIEIGLRARWRECVTEIASWVPGKWQPAVLWAGMLADLPALGYLARGDEPLPWMFRDPVLRIFAEADPGAREALLHERCSIVLGSSPEAPGHRHLPARPNSSRIFQAWLNGWRQRWPPCGDTASLEDLSALFETAMTQSGTSDRAEAMRKLRRLFRNSILCPAVAFVYMAFVACDMERLRAGLWRQALTGHGIIAP